METCPYTNLEIQRSPVWVDVPLDDDYKVDYFFVGSSILVAVGVGHVTAKGVRKAGLFEEILIRETLDTAHECIFLVDITQITALDGDAREIYRQRVQDRAVFDAVIFYGASSFLRMSIQLAKKIHLVDRSVLVVEDYHQAINLASKILKKREIERDVKDLTAKTTHNSPLVEIEEGGAIGELRQYGTSTYHIRCKGHLEGTLIVSLAEAILVRLRANPERPKGCVLLFDFGEISGFSFQTRRQYVESLRRIHAEFPIIHVYNYRVSTLVTAAINLSKILLPFPVSLLQQEADLIRQLNQLPSQLALAQDISNRKKQGQLSPEARLLDFITAARWDIPGKLVIPASMDACAPMYSIYEAFSLIKQDLDEVIQMRIRQEQDLRRLATEAQAATKAKTEFLATLSHEIRTPLNGVIGVTELLLAGSLDHEQRQHAEMIRNSGGHLMTIINDVLDVSKIESGRLALDLEQFNVQKTLEQCMDSWTILAKEKNIGLHCFVATDVPTFVIGDVGRFRQILTNLVSNSLKFTEKGNISVHVKILSYEMDGVRIHCEIHDTGIGIPKDKLHLLFKRFQQIDMGNTRKYGGSGLGLAISRQLAVLMGGDIGVESEESVGSVFWFTVLFQLPHASNGQSQQIGDQDTQDAEQNLNKEMGGLRVLVVEDNLINQKVVVSLLKKFGIEVDIANNGQEALEKMKRHGFDVVLMDCQMPTMDGYEATERIRHGETGKAHRDVRIIAMTANAMSGDRERCLSTGMDDYLSKPLTLNALKQAMKRSLAER